MEPFEVRVDQSVLDDLDDRLARTRFADQVEGTEWDQGTPVGYLRELVDYWRHHFDWRAQELAFNRLGQFTTTIDGLRVHFVHERSPHEGALPLLLVHGWPGSVVEFLDVAPRLADPTAFGGRAEDAFHVIAPSLPGYGFSDPPRTLGWDEQRIAVAFVELLARLGYERYGAQGGDWGAQVVTRMGVVDADHCAGLHLNMPLGSGSGSDESLTDEEQHDLAAIRAFISQESGYAQEQGTKPQTLGAGLNDSPAGLLAWIVEKFRTWSDCDGDLERCFTRDQLLTNVMLYWVTQTITSSARLYWESRRSSSPATSLPFVEVPTGVARYPKEVLRWPRSWIERQYRVVHWAEMDRGGHFPAMEQPELFVDDVRAFFRTVR